MYAPIEVQKEQFRKTVVEHLTYEELRWSLATLYYSGALTRSQVNKYKRWYRRMKRGDM